MANRFDPQPVDIDGDFGQVARAAAQHLSQSLAQTESLDREQQLQLLKQVLLNNPLLLAVLEDPEWQRSIREAAVPVPSEAHLGVTSEIAQNVQPGNVLNLSYYKLPHKVVVETCSYSANENKLAVTAIHYGRLGLMSPVTVLREDFQLPCNGSSVWLHTFPNSVLYSNEESLSRALSRLGERQHYPTSNNAHTLAVWCRVRDSRNLDSVRVPLLDDKRKELHQLMPADHIDVSIGNQQVHAIIASIESLDEVNERKVLSVVALSESLQVNGNALQTFGRTMLAINPNERVKKLQLELKRTNVEKNAEIFNNTHLCQECSDLMAINFLATGTAVEPKARARFTIHVSELRSNELIFYQGRIHFVMKVDQPERDDQTYQIHTVCYAPLNLQTAPKTTEIRLLVNLREAGKVQLVRHAEPDLQCPVLLNWKSMDSPLITTQAVEDLSQLQPGDAVSIQVQECKAKYPLSPLMPGLHAIVRRNSTSDGFVEVICFNAGGSGLVEVKRLPVSDHKFSKINFNVSRDLLSDGEDPLRRAEVRLGTDQYCIAWNNSRDFARWCCVNHKSNASSHIGVVTKPADLATLSSMQQSAKVRLQHQIADQSVLREVSLIDVSSPNQFTNVLKLSLINVDWSVKMVQIVKLENTSQLQKVRRVPYNGESVSEAQARILSETINILLDVSLANASDRQLGCGVSDQAFCTWLRGLKQAGLVELPALLSADAAADIGSGQDLEQVADLYELSQWDHVVIERPQAPQLHMLVLEFNVESGVLCGYTYAPRPQQDPGKRLDMYMYFPPDKATYPMHKVIRRTPIDTDASSELSASLAAGSNFADNVAAWAQLCALELDSNLLPQLDDDLNKLLKLMLRFAFRYASGQYPDDGSLQTCRAVLASDGFASSLKNDLRCEAASRRLYFIVRLMARMVESE
ncbi:hypothetical protein BOX15_Mlig026335g1 [Macrostomum lignano]|uniref:SHR-BD domain-containing protein n=2 Tax=Macrostomum lignano TaxID=282301 RepID=A0A1I8J654_9PLAT|nr:hypothetical protein BOX15_Mlig026335g1 [Macrostomum lignano]